MRRRTKTSSALLALSMIPLLSIGITACGKLAAETSEINSDVSQDIPALLTRYGASWANRDVDAIVALHTDDTGFRIMVSGVEPAEGKAELRQTLTGIFDAMPNYTSTRKNVRFGDNYAVFEYEIEVEAGQLAQMGDLVLGTSDTAYGIPTVDIIEFRDGLVSEKITYLDMETVRKKVSQSTGVQ